MIKVLHLTTSRLFGGVERFLLNLTERKELAPDIEFHFGLFYEGRFSAELKKLGAQSTLLGEPRWSRPWTILKSRRALKKLLVENKFDAVINHGGWVHSVCAPVLVKMKIKQILWQHDAPSPTHWIQRLGRLTRPNLIVANSEFTLATVRSLFRDVPAKIIFPPIELRQSSVSATRQMVRDRLGATKSDVVILQAARFDRCKGHAVLIDALIELNRLNLGQFSWKCWLASEPQSEQEIHLVANLKATAKAAGILEHLIFIGHQSSMNEVYAAADIYCQPNIGAEAFGIVFAESMLARLPLVTTKLGGVSELADSDCALWTDAGSALSVAKALYELIQSPERRGRMGLHGFERAHRLCDPAIQINKISKALLELGGAVS